MPCCWLEEEVEPAVAKVAEDLKGEAVAGCLGEEVEVASYPLEVAADLQQKHIRLGVLFYFADFLQ